MFVTKQPWMDQSLCRNENLTIFFLVDTQKIM